MVISWDLTLKNGDFMDLIMKNCDFTMKIVIS